MKMCRLVGEVIIITPYVKLSFRGDDEVIPTAGEFWMLQLFALRMTNGAGGVGEKRKIPGFLMELIESLEQLTGLKSSFIFAKQQEDIELEGSNYPWRKE